MPANDRRDRTMEQTWTGRDARWLQWTLFGIWVIFVIAGGWLIGRVFDQAGSVWVSHFALVAFIVLYIGLTIGVIIYTLRFRPITVNVDEKGIRIQQGSASNYIDYADMEAITQLPQTVSSGIGFQIYPSKDFLARTGSADNPERPSRRWAIPGMVFSDSQMKELAPSLREHAEQAGVHFYIAR